MRLLLGAFLLLVSCAAAPRPIPSGYCETPCGLRWQGNCTKLAKAEKIIAKAYAKHTKEFGDEKQICEAFAGYTVVVHRRDAEDKKKCWAGWLLAGAFCASGYTHYEERLIELFDAKFESNSLAHELGHVLSHTTVGGGHCAWEERGIKAAILEVTGDNDTTRPETCCVGEQYVSGCPL